MFQQPLTSPLRRIPHERDAAITCVALLGPDAVQRGIGSRGPQMRG